MTGETDLMALLRALDPALDATEYGFGTVPRGAALPPGLDPIGVFREDEGTTVIASAAALAQTGIEQARGWARITLRVHSSLQAVGLTAAVAAALAAKGISANVVAAYRHDHVFVPWDRRHDALAVLQACASGMDGANRR